MFETLSDARLLVVAGESPSFAEAGRRLAMPPATVTRRIAAMEAAAGLKLFERSTRAVRPTEVGETLIAHARRLIDEAESAAMSIETLRDTPRGWIRVTAPVILGQSLLGDVIGGFLAQNPDCDVFLDLSNERTDLISDGFDLAIRFGPVGAGDLIARKLGTASAALYRGTASRQTPLAGLDDLKGLPVGLLRRADRDGRVIRLTDAAGTMHDLHVAPRLITLDPLVLCDVALVNDLVVALPRMVAYPHVIAGRLRCELPEYSVQRSDVSAVFPSRRLMRPAVRAFIDHVASELPDKLERYEFPDP
ncbi:LysR substrate-binding domain-containing protein [Actibacterium sp. 188UL27-1]|uniref:LysR substrate-binding domain-containing protein n=1 Tax=Actibacterium sp. 188UL27-1 TaxID=2786961 RepID=UPI0019580BE6|nr:LysR substrate-binding domain-containing protein [Actibacterium sp. 188UL27-1]MBM7068922.1 LysR family transcriptional regulator [Actibacterium sp. 188UL27-1]